MLVCVLCLCWLVYVGGGSWIIWMADFHSHPEKNLGFEKQKYGTDQSGLLCLCVFVCVCWFVYLWVGGHGLSGWLNFFFHPGENL